jgi:hypothetical protein
MQLPIHDSYVASSAHLCLTVLIHLGTVLEQTPIETAPHGFFRQHAFLVPGEEIQNPPLHL